MLRRSIVTLCGRYASRGPLHPATPSAERPLASTHAYSQSRSPSTPSADAVQSPERSDDQPGRLAVSHDGPARPPLPGDSASVIGSDGHWMDRRLPGARRWLQDKSLEWWLRGVQARCKCDFMPCLPSAGLLQVHSV